MILINMIVAKRVNEISDLQLAYVCDHVRQQCIRTDIKRNAEKRVSRALIQLAMKRALVLDFELEERMARRKIYKVANCRVPSRNDQAARVWIGFDRLKQPRDLIYAVALRVMTAERTP